MFYVTLYCATEMKKIIVVCLQELRAFLVALDSPVHSEHLDFRVHGDTQALLDLLVFLEIPDLWVIRDLQVLRVF